LTLDADKISSASICVHQPQRSITSYAWEFGTLIIQNRRIAGLTTLLLPASTSENELGYGEGWNQNSASRISS
jgi:hypothetical protein